MKKYCFYNGKIVESKKFGFPFDDIGVIRGHAVFDYFRTYNGRPFRLADYFKRFTNSAKELGLTPPITVFELDALVMKLMKKNKMKDAAFRLILTGGTSSNHIRFEGNQNFAVIVEDLQIPALVKYPNGAKLITERYQRETPVAKTSAYVHAVKLQNKIDKAGAAEVLYHDKNLVLECSTSNIFIVSNGKLLTPRDNVLQGITRKVVIELARKNKIPVEERDVTMHELINADEVLITSSGKIKIAPIIQIDSKKIGNGKIGPVSGFMIQKFEELISKN